MEAPPSPHSRSSAPGAVISAGLLLGCGLGGFADGIVLHQILQWHNMLSSVRPPTDLIAMKYNMVWDGIFHAFTWVMTLAGVLRLWAVAHRPHTLWSSKAFAGALLMGWGLFNSVEGIVDHQILGIHHVHPGENQLAWDLGFIASGVAMLLVGFLLVRGERRADERSHAYPRAPQG